MTKLDNLVDKSKLTEKSSLRNSRYAAQCLDIIVGQFINIQVSGSSYSVIRYDLTNHDVTGWTTNATGSSHTDYSNDSLSVGAVFELWY